MPNATDWSASKSEARNKRACSGDPCSPLRLATPPSHLEGSTAGTDAGKDHKILNGFYLEKGAPLLRLQCAFLSGTLMASAGLLARSPVPRDPLRTSFVCPFACASSSHVILGVTRVVLESYSESGFPTPSACPVACVQRPSTCTHCQHPICKSTETSRPG